MQISVIIPLYNEADSFSKLFEWIRRVMNENNFSYEVIFVDDGSDDASWGVIESFKRYYDNVSGIRFRKNYSKSPALSLNLILDKLRQTRSNREFLMSIKLS